MHTPLRFTQLALLLAAAALAACAAQPAGPPTDTFSGTDDALLDKAVSQLQHQFHTDDPAGRANCVEALQPLFDPRATALIREALSDPEWVVRFAAAMAAGHRKLEEFAPTLQQLAAHDSNGSVRVGAAFALRRLGQSPDLPLFRQALASSDPAVRANAALAIGQLGDRSLIPLLQARAAEPDQRVRLEITAALARLGDPDAQRVIIAQALSKYGEDEWMAMDVCGDLPQNASAKALLLGLEPPPPNTPDADRPLTVIRQLVAARSLARQGSIQGADVAVSHLHDPEPQVRSLAALALGEILSPRGARQRLSSLLEDPDPAVRRAAAAAIVKVFARDRATK